MNHSEPDELTEKLRAWRVEPQIPSGFQREVWQRIAARQSAREEAFWPSAVRWLNGLLLRPQYAVALIMLSLGLSVAVAHVQAQDANARTWKALETRYALSVDPLAAAHAAHE